MYYHLQRQNTTLSLMSAIHMLYAILVSAMPVAELRGGLPLACEYGFPPAMAFFIAVFGNLLPVIPLFFALQRSERLLYRWTPTTRVTNWVFARTRRKGRLIARYGAIGLILIVAIPLPATGAWTGTIAAFLFGIPLRRAFPLIAGGVLIAGIIVLFAYLGAVRLFGISA